MKERPILFSAPMVRAVLAGTKTQTRRVMSAQPDDDASVTVEHFHQTVVDRHGDEQPGPEVFGAWWRDGERGLKCRHGQPGDQLWVRETHAPQPDCWGSWDRWTRGEGGPGPVIHYKASDQRAWVDRWRPSIHMPRWASRITLEIASVRVERLQSISREDALAEGIVQLRDGGYGLPAGEYYHHSDPSQSYFQLWADINGPGSVEANHWVWVINFKRLEAQP